MWHSCFCYCYSFIYWNQTAVSGTGSSNAFIYLYYTFFVITHKNLFYYKPAWQIYGIIQSFPVGQGAGQLHAFAISWKVAWKAPWSNNTWQKKPVRVAVQLRVIWWDDEKKQERHRERERETDRGIQGGGRRQSLALLFHLSVDLDEFVLTAEERIRQHLQTHLHTNTHRCISCKKSRDSTEREQLRVWVKVNNLLDGVK